MTTAQIHKIIFMNGLHVGITSIEHRDRRAGSRDENGVGYDELRYREGRKSHSKKVKHNYQYVMNGMI